MSESAFPILSSKITPARLPDIFIPRSMLEKQVLSGNLSESGNLPGQRILFFCAPVGYGKTTFLARLAELSELSHSWISLDQLDNDPARFAAYLGEALRFGGIPSPPESSNSHDILSILHRIEAFGKPFLLILDDAQEIENPEILSVLKIFLNYLPGNLTIAISSKENLPLSLSAHRQSGRLAEFRIDDLKAAETEMKQLLSENGVDIPDEGMKMIYKKTAGWWSCIKLFAVTWKQLPAEGRNRFLKHFNGTEQFIAEFILESFYSLLPEHIARFAATVSIPDFFTAGMCQLLISRDDCSPEIMYLRKLHVLIVREGFPTVQYRFNPLLRDYLRYRLSKRERIEIHEKAAAWFSGHGFQARSRFHSDAAKKLFRHETIPPAEDAPERSSHPGTVFSSREKEILNSLEKGFSNEEIGRTLYISTGTVKWHLNNIYGKLDVKTRAEAVHKARLMKIIL